MTGADVVIVGAGSAGCVLAERLSREPDRRVLLLEAGPDYPAGALPPDIADGRRLASSHDWGYHSVPDRHGHVLEVPRGRIVGGSSAVNACFALRGSPADYDAWAAAGNDGWAFDDVKSAFCAVETDLDFGDRAWHGSAGLLPVRRYPPEELTPVHRVFLEAAARCGHPYVPDHNEPGAVGAGPIPTNCIEGRRISAALAFLEPARSRPNLVVRAGVLVDAVLVAGHRAVGVRCADGERIDADLVVLAAGSYGSPAILLRSGIGPAEEVRALGIPSIVDLPGVGRGLVDHPAASIEFTAPASAPTSPTFQAVVTTRSAGASAGSPDLQLFSGGAWETDSPTGRSGAILVSVLKPASRGRLWLNSADPAAMPCIDLGHLREERDRARMVEVLHRGRDICESMDLKEARIASPAPRAWADDAELAVWLRTAVFTYHHPVGTCRMGTDPAEGAVVDPRGRLHGVSSLVVADASVMPDVPSANTNLPTIMVAHRLAELQT